MSIYQLLRDARYSCNMNNVQDVPAIQLRSTEALQLEHRLSDLVNQAYGLTPAEIDLMWKTAPPRMPIKGSINE